VSPAHFTSGLFLQCAVHVCKIKKRNPIVPHKFQTELAVRWLVRQICVSPRQPMIHNGWLDTEQT
jgi:hypothetical protein